MRTIYLCPLIPGGQRFALGDPIDQWTDDWSRFSVDSDPLWNEVDIVDRPEDSRVVVINGGPYLAYEGFVTTELSELLKTIGVQSTTAVARATGVPRNTLRCMAAGHVTSGPSYGSPVPRPIADSLQALLGCAALAAHRADLAAAILADVFAFLRGWPEGSQRDVWEGIRSAAEGRLGNRE